eukprot:9268495-Pyramimonas_sp.AAC.1
MIRVWIHWPGPWYLPRSPGPFSYVSTLPGAPPPWSAHRPRAMICTRPLLDAPTSWTPPTRSFPTPTSTTLGWG